MKRFQIGNKWIGENCPVFIVAEIGINHNGSVDTAKKLVDFAVSAGADAVKFQKRILTETYQKDVLDNPNREGQSFNYTIRLLKEFDLGDSAYSELFEYCRGKGAIFLCTPLDVPSVDFLEKIGVLAYKISSADLTNIFLLERIMQTNKPLILSTGMSSLEEIDHAIRFLRPYENFALLHCVSVYPAPIDELNLRFITTLADRCEAIVGYSGHEREIFPSLVAVALGAKIIERHITLDKTMRGPDHIASLEPTEFSELVRSIRNLEQMLGTGQRVPVRGEILNRDVLGKSLVARVNIPKGVCISKGMLTAKSPGKHISPQRLSEIVGRISPHDIKTDEPLLEGDFFPNETEYVFDFRTRWGFKTRFHDFSKLLRYNPKVVEFHPTLEDLNKAVGGDYSQELFVHAPEYYGLKMVDLCSQNAETRRLSIKVMQKTIDATMQLSKHFDAKASLVVHMGGVGIAPLENNQELVDNAVQSVIYLNLREINFLPENLPPLCWFFSGEYYQNAFVTAEDMVEFCESMGLNMCLDISHAKLACNSDKSSLEEYVRTVRKYTRHVHIADASGKRNEGLQIGDGEIDFNSALNQLSGFNFSWVPEIWRGHQEKGKGFLEALKKLNKYDVLRNGEYFG